MELDDAYANAAHIPGSDAYPDRWARQAAAFREGVIEQGLAELDVDYGDTPRQRFDLFLPRETPKGLFAFVHGGYWLRFDKSVWSHLAGGMLHNGWAVAMPSYDLAPQVEIARITWQIARFCEVAGQMVAGPIRLAGHSAGGHLVARMAVPGVLPRRLAERLAHVMPISPVADLRPMLKTSMNAQFRLDEAGAAAESPVLQRPVKGLPVTVWVGGDERPAFLDQAQWLADAWGCDHVVDPGKHHFDVIDALADADSKMVQTLLT
ncbi:alpha/beta hydrolase [Lutimaribacter sp. EGI FJ00015]|uniref:Alpha/beta hydrolase n=1 Tax=Lutimaribacter degradans TaxID=2945989 RepID=A0ACC5ZXJ0_9RHOB|nr:alpha/beta hydrolase [Lutimaribacter sp. EGI FJ00013]MCM2563059.1 alpha/beta hydrolase [Lutimaribacter sp. EGI FJ00013]MCO0614238.1 alpha/beta hydrolase [Lutimaribacter sp. EGI FJ00015]MCO0637048.1 alpha/beta hydrolase [Lutimaribacter sp. EGI FJ00014]